MTELHRVAAFAALLLLALPAGLATEPPSSAAPSESWRERTLDYRPYDGTGRYAIERDDGVRGIQGLDELARRHGVKPYRDLLPIPYDGTWQAERVIFHDIDTGAPIARLTNDPWPSALSYFKGNWNADGRWIVFRRRPGMWESSTSTHGPMAVAADGSHLRNVFRAYAMIRDHVCSPIDPNLCFAIADDKEVIAFDLASGNARLRVGDAGDCWHLKISPDGKRLMGRCLAEGRRGIWIVDVDGKNRREFALPGAIHDSYQFHPSLKKIMFWYEDRFAAEGFVQTDFDGKNAVKCPLPFDWNHGDTGPDRGAHADGYITRIRGDACGPKEPLFHRPGEEYYDDPADYNAYLAWMPKDQPWAFATRIVARPNVSEIQSFPLDPSPDGRVNRFRVCYTGLMRGGSVLDNPDASPDGTKVAFNSNMLGQVDLYCVTVRLPDPPRALRATAAPDGVRLAWQAPRHHAETAGYHVYRSDRSGVGFTPLTTKPVAAAEFVDRDARASAPTFYAVTSVEHSGLESGLSEEAVAADAPEAKRRVFLEAEQCESSPEMWIALQGTASNLHYLWMRTRDATGTAKATVALPAMHGPCVVWARVKGNPRAQFTLSVRGRSVALDAEVGKEWTWKRFGGTLDLQPGTCELTLASKTYGSAVDCLYVADDADFSPADGPRIAWPRLPRIDGLAGRPLSPYAVKVTWRAADVATFHHYNLYCGRTADFAADQAALVASPDRNTYCDWGVPAGETHYYRVTCVDRAGNESPPSAPAKVVLPGVKRTLLELAPAEQIEFDAPRNDTYVLWIKLRRDAGGGEYLVVDLDGRSKARWSCVFDGLADEAWFSYDQWARFPLSAGRHTLRIGNETGHAVQSVVLTNDLSYRPDGHVNILSGW